MKRSKVPQEKSPVQEGQRSKNPKNKQGFQAIQSFAPPIQAKGEAGLLEFAARTEYPAELSATPDKVVEQHTETSISTGENAQQPLQRKIGAEIEIPGTVIEYPDKTPTKQGEVVGTHGPGILTEIHLENPDKKYATLEFATGLHDQYPASNPLSLAYQTGYLDIMAQIFSQKGKSFLKDIPGIRLSSKWAALNGGKGPMVDGRKAQGGAFQVNVSPTKDTASTLQESFENVASFEYKRGAIQVNAQHTDLALQHAKTFAFSAYRNILIEAQKALKTNSLPSILKSTLKALISVPQVSYFKYLRTTFFGGFNSATRNIIDKNILDLLPRANLKELWTATLADAEVRDLEQKSGNQLSATISKILGVGLKNATLPKVTQVDAAAPGLEQETQAIVEGLLLKRAKIDKLSVDEMLSKETEVNEVLNEIKLWRSINAIVLRDDPIEINRIKQTAHSDMLAVISGTKILIKNRNGGEEKAASIMTNTDSSLLPVNKQQGEAGVFEIRNPFSNMIPLGEWEAAMAEYEKMLKQKGVKY